MILMWMSYCALHSALILLGKVQCTEYKSMYSISIRILNVRANEIR
jgi:hypothetical protein